MFRKTTRETAFAIKTSFETYVTSDVDLGKIKVLIDGIQNKVNDILDVKTIMLPESKAVGNCFSEISDAALRALIVVNAFTESVKITQPSQNDPVIDISARVKTGTYAYDTVEDALQNLYDKILSACSSINKRDNVSIFDDEHFINTASDLMNAVLKRDETLLAETVKKLNAIINPSIFN